MAGLALLVLFCELLPVRVRVTGPARGIRFPSELSGVFRLDDVGLMAGDAICRNVCARQGKFALNMALDSVEDNPEVPVDMACLAFSSVRARRKLSAMCILVAVRADVKLRNVKTLFAAGIHRTGSRGVACQAFDVRVLSIERELRSLVVERFPLRCFPVSGGMALVAAAGELFQVRVAVARFAGRKLHATVENGPGMIHGCIVAPCALHLPVLSCERVAGMIVRKERRRLPSFRVVARGAWSGELAAVCVRMT